MPKRPGVIDRLRQQGLIPLVLRFLLNLAEPPRPGSAVRCAYPERHKNGDAHPSLVIRRDGAGAKCQVCRFGGGLLEITRDRLNLPDHKAAAAALEERFLREKEHSARPGGPIGSPQAIYDYVDENGKMLFQVLRFGTIGVDGKPDKTFRQRRPDPERPGEWLWNLKGVRRVLFPAASRDETGGGRPRSGDADRAQRG